MLSTPNKMGNRQKQFTEHKMEEALSVDEKYAQTHKQKNAD